MEVLGRENIPDHGPIIFTGNHMNQFVDGGVMMVTAPHRIGLLVAEKSFHKLVIGSFAKAMGSIPVARAQDYAKAGPGKIRLEGLRVQGIDTKFTLLTKGDRIRPSKSADSYRFKEIISDTEGILADDYGEASPLHDQIAQGNLLNYDILQHVDQSKMFDAVQAALANGQCLGIFPEGGSHDRTDLLPLKVTHITLYYTSLTPLLGRSRGDRIRYSREVRSECSYRSSGIKLFPWPSLQRSCGGGVRRSHPHHEGDHRRVPHLKEICISNASTRGGRRNAIGDCDCVIVQRVEVDPHSATIVPAIFHRHTDQGEATHCTTSVCGL